tara:strand:+ start:227 stop:472 length:246 start_codon:yes stop_codon:yes gene_type:complete
MLLQNIKEFGKRLFSGEQSNLVKIFSTLSLIWMMIVGYLVWWNGISSPGFDKSFKWDEWIWFGFVPAITPFLFYLIWKKRD